MHYSTSTSYTKSPLLSLFDMQYYTGRDSYGDQQTQSEYRMAVACDILVELYKGREILSAYFDYIESNNLICKDDAGLFRFLRSQLVVR